MIKNFGTELLLSVYTTGKPEAIHTIRKKVIRMLQNVVYSEDPIACAAEMEVVAKLIRDFAEEVDE